MSVRAAPVLGVGIYKPAVAIPQNATGVIFSNTGGVIINLLLGVYVTAASAQTISFGAGGSNSAFGSFSSGGLGTAILVAGAHSLALSAIGSGQGLQAAGVPFSAQQVSPFLASGNITWTTTASNPGEVDWYCYYVPIAEGAVLS